MNHYIEEIVNASQDNPIRLWGNPWAVFRMLSIIKRYQPYPEREPLEWELWLVNKEN